MSCQRVVDCPDQRRSAWDVRQGSLQLEYLFLNLLLLGCGIELVAEPINQVHPTHFGEHRRQHWLVRGDRLCDCEIHRLQRDEKASFPACQFGLDLVKLEDLEVFNIQRVAAVVVGEHPRRERLQLLLADLAHH